LKTSASSTGKPATEREIFLALSAREQDEIPTGWRTTKGWSQHLGLGLKTTEKRLRALLDAGHAERTEFVTRAGNVVRPVPHYWIPQLSAPKPHGKIDYPTVFPAASD
jgi:hypothetical protein